MIASGGQFLDWCKVNKWRVLCFAVLLAVLVVGMAFFAWLTDGWGGIADTPVATGGVIDFSDRGDITQKIMNPYLVGEWEFFYNRWIVTDGDTGAPDGMVELPGRWTDQKHNGERLPKSGYASYRLTMENVHSSVPIGVTMIERQVAYRAYINGVLVTTCGEVERTERESRVTFVTTYHQLYAPVSNSDTLEIVIEIGANSHGGLVAAPAVHVPVAELNNSWVGVNFTLDLAPYITIGTLLMALGFCFLLPNRNRRGANLLALFLGLLLVRFLTGEDGGRCVERFITLDKTALILVRQIVSFAIPVVFVLALWKSEYITTSRGRFALVAALCAVGLVAALLLRHTIFQLIPLAIPILVLCLAGWRIFRADTSFKFFVPLLSITVMMLGVYYIEMFTSQGLVTFGTAGIESIGFFAISVLFSVLIILRMKEINKIAMQKLQADAEISKMKQQTLQAQIKPHFVFNTMAAIQSAYQQGTELGNEMMVKFANHLRANADSNNMELVPFEMELKNILNYFELENMRANGQLNLILDVDFTDFSIPPLSLQPFLENAIQYAGTEGVRDGNICIASTLDSNNQHAIVSIVDNGKGFDPKSVRQNAVGIKNATERLVHGAKATVVVESSVGVGTTVTLTIPLLQWIKKEEP